MASSVSQPERQGSPFQEAQALLALLAARKETPGTIRSLLRADHCDPATAAYRKATQLHFDSLLLCISVRSLRAGQVRVLRRANGRLRPSKFLEAEILTRLRSGKSTTCVARELRVVNSAVRRIAAKHGTAFEKVGRGRRFTDKQIQVLAAALRSGVRPAKLMRRHRVSGELLRKIRRTYLHDFSDRRLRLSWDLEAVKRALRDGKRPSVVERETGIDHGVLWRLRRKLGDSVDWRHRNCRVFSETERADIIHDIRARIPQRTIAFKFRTHYQKIRELQIEIGLPPRTVRRFTPAEGLQIEAAIAAGQTDQQIARTFCCTSGAVWARRKQLRAAKGVKRMEEKATTYQQAAERFRAAQERLEAFVQQHIQVNLDGPLVDERSAARLASEYATLKAEHDDAGAAWARALENPMEARQ